MLGLQMLSLTLHHRDCFTSIDLKDTYFHLFFLLTGNFSGLLFRAKSMSI